METAYVSCAGFKFYSNFDSANFARVEQVFQQGAAPLDNAGAVTSKTDVPTTTTFEFNVWTKPDCAGTEFENGNRTWFYFGIKAAAPSMFVRLNIIDINKQAKMYSQGMAPVFKVVPGKPIWERIRDKLTYSTNSENIFSLSFKYRTPDNPDAIVYFAFTYPYSYMDLQHSLRLIDEKYLHAPRLSTDDIYYVRECVCKSVEGRRIDLLTISSHHNMTMEREDRLQFLFPDKNVPRPFKFDNKKVVFVSARVHPGETPSTFVLNGLLNLLLSRDDPVGLVLRRHYVFKMVPFLNPDGVSRGHYRTDTRGTNLNRVYLQPNIQRHPSVYAARALLRYHHHGGREILDRHLTPPGDDTDSSYTILSTAETTPLQHQPPAVTPVTADVSNAEIVVERDVSTLIETNDRRMSNMSLTEEDCGPDDIATHAPNLTIITAAAATTAATANSCSREHQLTFCKREHNMLGALEENDNDNRSSMDDVATATLQRLGALVSGNSGNEQQLTISSGQRGGEGDTAADVDNATTTTNDDDDFVADSGLFLYMDMHGHASKKGIFMYGNHFDNMADSVECMLLPKIMSLNNHNFHFTACNFTERNMYLKDRRDGMSREGSGRVAVSKLTGLVRSYTLECNYNTGRLTNNLPPTVRNSDLATADTYSSPVPPKYNPQVFEEVGRAVGASILDLTGQNPLTRLPNSEFHSLSGLRHWLMSNCVSSAAATTCTAINIHHYPPQQINLPLTQPSNTSTSHHQLQTVATCSGAVDGVTAAATTTTATAAICANRKSSQSVWRSNIGQALSGGNRATALMRYHHHHNRRRHYPPHHHYHTYLRHTAAVAATSTVAVTPPPPSTTPSTAAAAPTKRRLSGKSGNSMMQAALAASFARQQHHQQMSLSSTSTAKRVLPSTPTTTNNNNRRLKLREICWIKGGADTGQGKALIAKYTTCGGASTTTAPTAAAAAAATSGGGAAVGMQSEEENLIVSWDVNNANPQVFAQRASINSVHHVASCSTGSNQSGARTSRCTSAAAAGSVVATAGGGNKRPTFRVHNFRRRHHHHPVITLTTAAPATSASARAAGGGRQPHQQQRLRTTTKQTTSARQANNKTTKKQATTPAEDATATAAAASTSGATTEQPQQQRLQRTRRKRKRNKSGLVGMAVHH